MITLEGGREEGGREGRREGGREGGREVGREGGGEGGRGLMDGCKGKEGWQRQENGGWEGEWKERCRSEGKVQAIQREWEGEAGRADA